MSDLQNIIQEIKAQDPQITVLSPGQVGYHQAIEHWLESSTQLSQYAIVPFSASDISTVMKVFSSAQVLPRFSVEGGGHIGIPGWSSTPGIHISMEKFTNMTLNPDNTVDVGAACNWDQLYTYLGAKGRGVVGGARHANVGVAGYTLGGGFSVKSSQYGLAMDTVTKYQVVMPNGYILQNVSANAPDEGGFPVSQLFYALQGGGNNFGIVTTFTFATHPQGPVYGGSLTYDPSQLSVFVNAITTFIKSNITNPDILANIECGFNYLLAPGDDAPQPDFTAACFYNGEKPAADPFQQFLNIPHTGGLSVGPFEEFVRRTYIDWAGPPKGGNGPPPPAAKRGRMDCVMVNGYTPGLIDLIVATAKASSVFMVKEKGRRVYWDVWPFLSTIYQNSPPPPAQGPAWPHPPPPAQAYTPIPIFYLWDDDVTPGDKDRFWIDDLVASVAVVKAYAKKHGLTPHDDSVPIYSNLTLGTTSVQQIYQGNLTELSDLRKLCDNGDVMRGAGGFRIPLPS